MMNMPPGRQQAQIPVQRAPSQSTWICPQCETIPPLAENPQFPFGTPAAHVVQLQGELQFRCMACVQAFQTALIMQNVPRLVKRAEYDAWKAEQLALETPPIPEYTEDGPEPEAGKAKLKEILKQPPSTDDSED